ncbi:MarR family transcriptional regulator [Halorubraceae archaeon YAN]|nr:MarR family transcriptional regulator [Halorubraceae archaeon YAN]
MTDTGPRDLLSLIVRRGDVLRTIDSPGMDKRDIVSQLNVSRSTVDRAVRELESAELIERTDNVFRRTLAGELALDAYETFEEQLSAISASCSALRPLPPETEIDSALLVDADVISATIHEPHQPIAKLCELCESARWVHLVLPAVFPQILDSIVDAAQSEQLRADLVITQPVLQRLLSTDKSKLTTLTESEYVTIRQTELSQQYVPLIIENDSRTIGGLLIVETNGASALILNEDPDAVTRVSNKLRQYLESAEPIKSHH